MEAGRERGPLSPSEELTLAMVREGAPDAEIAVRLGISTGEARRRVDQLALRLGAGDRATLRAMAAGEAAPGPEAVAPGTDAVDASASSPGRRGRFDVRAGAVLLVALLVSAIGLWWVSRGASDATEASPPAAVQSLTPIPSVSPGTASPTPWPTPFGALGVRNRPELFDLFDVSVLLRDQCAVCVPGSRAPTLGRVTRPGRGRDLGYVPLRMPAGLEERLIDAAADLRGWTVAASFCIEEEARQCREAAPDQRTALWLSEDGGVSWREVETFARQVRPLLIAAEGVLIEQYFSLRANVEPRPVYRWVRPGAAMEFGPEPGWLEPVGVAGDGRSLWRYTRAGDRALPELGGNLLRDAHDRPVLELPIPRDAVVLSVVPLPASGLCAEECLLVAWTTANGDGPFATVALPDGTSASALAPYPFAFERALPVVGSIVIGTGQAGVAPGEMLLPLPNEAGPSRSVAVANLASGELWRVGVLFAHTALDNRHVRLLAARRGPFLVAVPRADCVAVVDEPGGEPIACFAAGVLLGDADFEPETLTRPVRLARGEAWVKVSWPGWPGSADGAGWARFDEVRPAGQ